MVEWYASRYQANLAVSLKKYGLRYDDLYDPRMDLVSGEAVCVCSWRAVNSGGVTVCVCGWCAVNSVGDCRLWAAGVRQCTCSTGKLLHSKNTITSAASVLGGGWSV